MTLEPPVTTTPPPFPDGKPPFVVPADIRWGLTEVVLAFAAFFISQVFGIVLVGVLGISASDETAVGFASFVFGLITYGAFLAVLFYASRRKGLRSLAADFGLQFRLVDIPLGIAAAIAAKIAAIVIGVFAVAVTGESPNTSNLQLSSDPLWVLLNAVVIATFVAPIVEELVFRGLVLRSVRNLFTRRRPGQAAATERQQKAAIGVAIVVSSTAFAALHLMQATSLTMAIVLGGATFAVGIINAVLAIRTGRLGAAIITHVLYNGSSVLLVLVLGAAATT